MIPGCPVSKVGLTVQGRLWSPGCPQDGIGKWTAVDTETLLIDDTKPSEYPDVVLMTVYGGGKVVDLVMYEHIQAYLYTLLKSNSVVVFHNAPFDMNVTGIKQWIPVIDANRVVDTGLQWILHKMGTVGLSDEADEYPALKRVVQDVLGQELEKDHDVRCTFTRGMDLDEAHFSYACGDAMATWLAAVAMAPDYKVPPTMDIQVKGFVCLDFIARNGLLVDKEWMTNLRNDFVKQMDELKLKLEDLGIKVDKELERSEIIPYVQNSVLPSFPSKPTVDDIRAALYVLSKDPTDPDNPWENGASIPKGLVNEWKQHPTFGVPEKATPKQLINVLWKAAMNIEEGKDPGDGMQEWWDKHDGWPPGYKQVGTATQLQNLLTQAEQFLTQKLPRTASGKIALDDKALEGIPKEDLKRLKFLDAWKTYKHAEKMVSTYLDEKIIKADGRVHPRFCPIKATGRVSCRSPNVQNLPRDDRLRGVYIADPGYVLCSCDYNQQELIALAQVTYTRFGHSLMRDLINHSIDIHGFMGSTIKGIFEGLPKFDVTNAELVEEYTKRIKEFKKSEPKEFKRLRQLAKALDFGFSGIGYSTLYYVSVLESKRRLT